MTRKTSQPTKPKWMRDKDKGKVTRAKKGQTVFLRERDLRKRIRSLAGQRVFWTEPNLGSTVGYPDATLVRPDPEGSLRLAELKVDEIVDCVWSGDLRPSQVKVVRELLALGNEPLVIVGAYGTSDIYLCDPRLAVNGTKRKDVTLLTDWSYAWYWTWADV